MRRTVRGPAASPSPNRPFGPGPPSPGVRERVLSAAKRVGAIHPAIFPQCLETPRAAAGLALLVLVVLAPGLTGCGKKDLPTPPPGAPNTYPRPYPRE